MLLPEPLEEINKRLEDHFGRFEDGRPNFRVVFADEQFENRFTEYVEGIHLLTPVVREFPKYPYDKGHYVLERLLGVVGGGLTTKTSYEPIWVFRGRQKGIEVPVPPVWHNIKFLLDSLFDKLGKKTVYKEDEKELPTKEAIQEKIRNMEKLLFGNETAIGDSLAHGEGVGYTGKAFEQAMKDLL